MRIYIIALAFRLFCFDHQIDAMEGTTFREGIHRIDAMEDLSATDLSQRDLSQGYTVVDYKLFRVLRIDDDSGEAVLELDYGHLGKEIHSINYIRIIGISPWAVFVIIGRDGQYNWVFKPLIWKRADVEYIFRLDHDLTPEKIEYMAKIIRETEIQFAGEGKTDNRIFLHCI